MPPYHPYTPNPHPQSYTHSLAITQFSYPLSIFFIPQAIIPTFLMPQFYTSFMSSSLHGHFLSPHFFLFLFFFCHQPFNYIFYATPTLFMLAILHPKCQSQLPFNHNAYAKATLHFCQQHLIINKPISSINLSIYGLKHSSSS